MGRAWRPDELLPSTTALRLLSVSATEAGVSVEAEGQSAARCPACGRLSRTRHSRYWRTLKDLAVQGQVVTLRLHVSRWRCRQARCATQVFTERLPGVCVPHARHTQRFANIIHLVGYARQILINTGVAIRGRNCGVVPGCEER
jgi:transposase